MIDIGQDRRGEFFDIQAGEDADIAVLDVQPLLSPLVAEEEAVSSDQRALRALERHVSLGEEELTLAQAVEQLHRQMEASLVIDNQALKDVGISPDAVVTQRFPKMQARHLLQHLLRPLYLTWTVKDGDVIVTTFEQAEDDLNVGVFAVDDLIHPDQGDPWAPADYDSVINLITAVASPESWFAQTGLAPIWAFRGMLVIPQTQEVLTQIEHVLSALRQARNWTRENPTKPPASPAFVASDEGTKKVFDLLNQPGDYSYSKTELTDLARRLEQDFQIAVIVDRRALEDIGFDIETSMVSYSAKRTPLGVALRSMSKPLELTYYVEAGAVIITTREEAKAHPSIRVYPVADLLGAIEDEASWPLENLEHAVVGAIAAESWDTSGGLGILEPFPTGHSLVISHTIEVHNRVERLLRKMRAKRAAIEKACPHPPQTRPDEMRLIVYAIVQPRAAGPHTPSADESNPGGFGGSVAGFGGGAFAKSVPEKELMAIIKSLVAPQSWQERDDVYLKVVAERLIVRHTVKTHRKIVKLARSLGINIWQASDGDFLPGQPEPDCDRRPSRQ